jgi:hypothetical protein
MPDHQIICTRKTPASSEHHHITSVGTGSGTTHVPPLLSIQDVYQAMNNGDRFFTLSPSTGKVAWVHPATCCDVQTLRSSPDSVTDNNLDALARCGD